MVHAKRYPGNMTDSIRRPSVLAYKAVRDADTTDDAKRVYDAMKASACRAADLCALDEACPFYVGCLLAENDGATD